ncbi:hypothetical protein GCM10010831_02000 [Psychroflexus salis]|uniref:Anticodon-binding domain-containing protein n=1 Tax=Psychroflexus salis TaxID=1526574 RepID=A0A916ZM07_9FLAO|nr:hypothetical protein GCM10010831_02000 [Psychroflexus salis]
MILIFFCITVDHETKEDGCVTIRHRDSMEQKRIKIEELNSIIAKEVSFKNCMG